MKQTITLFLITCCLLISQLAKAQCDPATNLQANYNNNVSTFTWDPVTDAQTYLLQIKYPVYNWSNTIYEEVLTNNILVLTDIIQSATFEWRIITTCPSGSSTSASSIYALPCPQPTSLNASNVDVTSATINWTPAPGLNTYLSDFVASYRKVGTTSWTSLGHTFDSYKNITGLLPSTTYEYCVQQTCAYFNSAPSMSQFTTLPSCYAPTGLINVNTTATQATLSWTVAANALSYDVQYKANSSTTWVSAGSTSSNNITITGLSQSTLYDWRVMTVCNSTSGPYATAQFTTSGVNGCGVPTGLNVTNIGNYSATFNCVAVSGANSYQVQLKQTTASNWNTYTTSNNSGLVVNGLAMNKAYQCRIRTKCGGVYSPYSPIVTFNTMNCQSSGINSAEWIDYFNVGSLFRSSGKETGGYKSTGQTVNLLLGSTRTGTISAGFTSTIFQELYAVYIDLNRNGSYNDVGELLASGNFTNSTNNAFSITLPLNATAGPAGMRVVLRRNGTGYADPCYTGFYGETEDFIVNLLSPRISSNKLDVAEIVASPNPSSAVFHIAMGAEQSAIYMEVTNMNGSVIQRKSINTESNFDIDLGNLPNGLYILRVKDEEGQMHTQKLVKQY